MKGNHRRKSDLDITLNPVDHHEITPRMARMGLKVLINDQESAPIECLADTHVSTLPIVWNSLTSSRPGVKELTGRTRGLPPAR